MAGELTEEIINTLTKKGKCSESTLRVRIAQIRRKNPGLTLLAASQIYAGNKGTSILAKLSDADRESLAKFSNPAPMPSNIRKIKTGFKTVIIKTQFGSINEPFLPVSVKKEALKMAEGAYLSLYILENSIRNFIIMVMERDFGTNWWAAQMNTSKKLSDILDRVKGRIDKEEQMPWHGKRGAHPIFYSDFDHLIIILKSFKNNFDKFFRNEKRKTDWLIAKLEEIAPSRNVSSHHNPLSDRDLGRVEGNLMDWVKQLEYIRDKKLF